MSFKEYPGVWVPCDHAEPQTGGSQACTGAPSTEEWEWVMTHLSAIAVEVTLDFLLPLLLLTTPFIRSSI